jgi:hypothetical protein
MEDDRAGMAHRVGIAFRDDLDVVPGGAQLIDEAILKTGF